jgi:hypothetical protein
MLRRSPSASSIACLTLLGGLAAFTLTSSSAVAQDGAQQPAAKATARVGDLAVLAGPTVAGTSESPWVTILANNIKTSSQKDLIATVALECGLYTSTVVKSKGGTRDTSTASASIQVRVLVDGQPAAPGTVTFARRNQQLTAVFQGLIDGALSVDPETGTIEIDESLLEPEEVGLLLESLDAASFTFVLPDVGTGVHRVEVQARIDLGAAAQAGEAVARATVGKGCMTVEEVRMIRGEDAVF